MSMAMAGSARIFRLAVLLPLLAVIFCFAAIPSQEGRRSEPARIASKPYADAGSGRVRVLRPTRIQVRMPRGFHPADKDGEKLKAAVLHQGGVHAERGVAALAPPPSEIRPDLFPFRTHNPRDPPRAA